MEKFFGLNLAQRQMILNSEFKQLQKDFDKIADWWIKNKECRCGIDDYDIFCEHFEFIINTTLGKKAEELRRETFQIGIDTLNQVTRN